MRNIDLEAERRFENRKVAGDRPRRAQSRFYWATQPKITAFDATIAETIRGKRVLEIGCTHGKLSLELARHAAHLTGVDISDAGIRTATQRAATQGVTNATFVCCDAHHLPFEDASFDACVAISVLHHLDFAGAVAEINRVLKPGGLLLAREPLGTNPLFQLYRHLTPDARTVDEKPLDRGDFDVLRQSFDLNGSDYFGLTAVLAGLIRAIPGATTVRDALIAFDERLARTAARWLCWQVNIVGRSRK